MSDERGEAMQHHDDVGARLTTPADGSPVVTARERARAGKKPTTQKAALEATLVRRLADRYEAHVNQDLDAMSVACLLGIGEDDAREMFELGAIKTFRPSDQPSWGTQREVGSADMRRWLERHGQAWFRVRLAKMIEQLER